MLGFFNLSGVGDNFDLATCHGCPTLASNIQDINAMVFQGKQLKEGWPIDSVVTPGTAPQVNWVMREPEDCVHDIKALARALEESMKTRYTNVPSYLEDLEQLFSCFVGQRTSSGKVTLDERSLEKWGAKKFAKFSKYCAALPHIQRAVRHDDLEFDEELSHVYHRQFKQAMKNHLWNANNESNGTIGNWFLMKRPQKKIPKTEKYVVLSSRHPRFRIESLKALPLTDASRCRLHAKFLLRISSCKDELQVRINEEAIIKSMYTDSILSEAIGCQYMIAFDIALAKGGPEAIVESYYSCMDAQKMKGGQTTDSLSTRSIIVWCMPNAMQNERAVQEITREFLKKHKKPVIGGKKRTTYSKTLDRLAKENSKISFLT